MNRHGYIDQLQSRMIWLDNYQEVSWLDLVAGDFELNCKYNSVFLIVLNCISFQEPSFDCRSSEEISDFLKCTKFGILD